MRKLITSSFALLVTLAVVIPSWAKVEFDSSQLMMQNSDQVTELVRKRIQKASDIQDQQDADEPLTAEPEALEYLKDAMRIALSRPDQDGLRGILFTRIRRELNDLGSTDKVLDELTDEAIASLKDKKDSVAHQSTYIMVLENLMAEIKPEIEKNKTFHQIIEKIRDANIKVSKDVQSANKLKMMKQTESPSKTAALILPKKKK